jgi:hypothetical protein
MLFKLLKPLRDFESAESRKCARFLIRIQEIFDLSLVPEPKFISTLLTKSNGRCAQRLGVHLSSGSKWLETRAALFRTFNPSRVREQLYYMLEC